jgi:hypothetical protein
MARLAAVSAFVADRVGQHYDDVLCRVPTIIYRGAASLAA